MDLFLHTKFPEGKYSGLQPGHLMGTLKSLQHRIAERFPESGLGKVSLELETVAQTVVRLCGQLKKPLWPVRLLTGLSICILIGLAAWLLVRYVRLPAPTTEATGLSELAQGTEAAINELIFLALSIFFLVSIETRLKRRSALDSLHRLRSIAHVVDMHQLTKDPAFLLSNHTTTATSPLRTMNAFELTRYLDYCSELLAIISKLAALHAQDLQDAQVLDTVNDVENLCHGLSSKIWQKIMVIDTVASTLPSPIAPAQ